MRGKKPRNKMKGGSNAPDVCQARTQLFIENIHVDSEQNNNWQGAHRGRSISELDVHGQAPGRRVALDVRVRLVAAKLHVRERLGRRDHGSALPNLGDVLRRRHRLTESVVFLFLKRESDPRTISVQKLL